MSTDEANREGLVSLPVTAVLDMRSAICRAVGLREERTRWGLGWGWGGCRLQPSLGSVYS